GMAPAPIRSTAKPDNDDADDVESLRRELRRLRSEVLRLEDDTRAREAHRPLSARDGAAAGEDPAGNLDVVEAGRDAPASRRRAVSPLGALGTPYALRPGEHPSRWGTGKLSGKVGYSSPAIRKNRSSAGLDGRARYSVLIDEPRWRLNGRAAFPELLEGQRG